MTLSSTNIIPELQASLNTFVINSSVNKYGAPSSIELSELYLKPKSFIKLLFDDSYTEISYYHLYVEQTNKFCWPRKVLDRAMIYPTSAKYFESDSTGVNMFQLQVHDLTMLDALLSYRLNPNTLSIVDSTAVVFTDSTSSTVLEANLESLSTNLSKLIFLYLDLKVNDNYQDFNNIIIISNDSNLLEVIYETYVVDEMFKFISSQGT